VLLVLLVLAPPVLLQLHLLIRCCWH